MNKRLSLLICLCLSLFLVGCDYPEKSFQALSEYDVPKEVTMDFQLPMGVYEKFIWTSENENILNIYDERFVQVNQQKEDIEVNISARINKRTKTFTIKVLKIGSEATIYEQSKIALDNLNIPKQVIQPFEVPFKSGNICLEYESYSGCRVVQKEDLTIWIVPDIVNTKKNIKILVNALYEKDGALVAINSRYYDIDILVDLENTIEHNRIFKNISIGYAKGNNQDYITEDFTLPIRSTLNEDATIKWESKDSTTIEISEDGTTAHVKNKTGIWNCSLVALITIDEISYQFNYLTTVHPLNNN